MRIFPIDPFDFENPRPWEYVVHNVDKESPVQCACCGAPCVHVANIQGTKDPTPVCSLPCMELLCSDMWIEEDDAIIAVHVKLHKSYIYTIIVNKPCQPRPTVGFSLPPTHILPPNALDRILNGLQVAGDLLERIVASQIGQRPSRK